MTRRFSLVRSSAVVTATFFIALEAVAVVECAPAPTHRVSEPAADPFDASTGNTTVVPLERDASTSSTDLEPRASQGLEAPAAVATDTDVPQSDRQAPPGQLCRWTWYRSAVDNATSTFHGVVPWAGLGPWSNTEGRLGQTACCLLPPDSIVCRVEETRSQHPWASVVHLRFFTTNQPEVYLDLASNVQVGMNMAKPATSYASIHPVVTRAAVHWEESPKGVCDRPPSSFCRMGAGLDDFCRDVREQVTKVCAARGTYRWENRRLRRDP